MDIEWVSGARIRVDMYNSEVVITANREGLLSLSSQMAALADAGPGSHIHYDEYNSLEEGSVELIIGKSLTSSADEL